MSYEGFSRNSEIYKEKTWPDRYMVFKSEIVQTIKDGRVIIVIKELELVVDVPVKGTKGQGAADADQLTEPNPTHLIILKLLNSISGDPSLTNDQIMDMMDRDFKMRFVSENNSQYKPVDRNATRRPLSELLRKGAIYPDESKKNHYRINKERIKKILGENKF